MTDCERLEQEMEEFQSTLSAHVERVISRTQFTIREPRKPVSVDDLSPQVEETLLPPPLLPQNLTSSSESLDTFTSSSHHQHTKHSPCQDDPDHSQSLSSYVGFSAQSASIPSISCNTADTFLASPAHSTNQSAGSSFTPSSTSSSLHSIVSPPQSPARDQNQ